MGASSLPGKSHPTSYAGMFPEKGSMLAKVGNQVASLPNMAIRAGAGVTGVGTFTHDSESTHTSHTHIHIHVDTASALVTNPSVTNGLEPSPASAADNGPEPSPALVADNGLEPSPAFEAANGLEPSLASVAANGLEPSPVVAPALTTTGPSRGVASAGAAEGPLISDTLIDLPLPSVASSPPPPRGETLLDSLVDCSGLALQEARSFEARRREVIMMANTFRAAPLAERDAQRVAALAGQMVLGWGASWSSQARLLRPGSGLVVRGTAGPLSALCILQHYQPSLLDITADGVVEIGKGRRTDVRSASARRARRAPHPARPVAGERREAQPTRAGRVTAAIHGKRACGALAKPSPLTLEPADAPQARTSNPVAPALEGAENAQSASQPPRASSDRCSYAATGSPPAQARDHQPRPYPSPTAITSWGHCEESGYRLLDNPSPHLPTSDAPPTRGNGGSDSSYTLGSRPTDLGVREGEADDGCRVQCAPRPTTPQSSQLPAVERECPPESKTHWAASATEDGGGSLEPLHDCGEGGHGIHAGRAKSVTRPGEPPRSEPGTAHERDVQPEPHRHERDLAQHAQHAHDLPLRLLWRGRDSTPRPDRGLPAREEPMVEEETREPGARASGGLSATAQPTSLESSPSPEAPQIPGSMGLDGEERACPSYPPEATLAGIYDIPRAMMVEDFDAQGSRTVPDGLVGPGIAHGQLAGGTAKAADDAQADPPIPSGFIDGFTSSPISRIGTLDLPSLPEAGGTSQRCAQAPAATTALAGAGGDSIGSERVEELPCAQALLNGPNLATATHSTVDKEVQSGLSAAAEPQNGLKGVPNARDLHEEPPSSRSGRLRTPSRVGASRDTAAVSVTSTPVIPRLPRQELNQDASSVAQSFGSPISASQPLVGSMAGPAIPFEHGFGPTVEAVENSEGRASPGSALTKWAGNAAEHRLCPGTWEWRSRPWRTWNRSPGRSR